MNTSADPANQETTHRRMEDSPTETHKTSQWPLTVTPRTSARVLIVEDEPIIMFNAEAIVLEMGHQPLLASKLAQAKEIIATQTFDIALIDLNLPDGSGYQLLQDIQATGAPFAFLTGYHLGDDPRFTDLVILKKPYDLAAFENTVAGLLARSNAQRGPGAIATRR